MPNNGRAEPIGELIRQLRRRRNITQTELGAPRYSKSYVSAVEKNTIRPSPEALQFFAEQLDQPSDYFTSLREHPKDMKQEAALQGLHAISGQSTRDEGFHLLSLLLERADYSFIRAMEALPPLAPELIAALPPSEQANYFFLEGMMAQMRQEHEAALHALERALPLASAQLQPAVLDALGQHYYLTRSYATALHYHHRAFVLLQHAALRESEHALLFPVTLHCGEDYRALGAYMQACDMYERALPHLHAEHEMKSAALLYLGLGYCNYALSYQAAQALNAGEDVKLEEMERGFQRAIGFVVQSREICQLSSDLPGEVAARLLLVVAELDFITRRRQLVSARGAEFLTSCFSLLDDVEEQCRQVLVSCQDMLKQGNTSTAPHVETTYVALAYLVRTFIQRAALTRLSGHEDLARRERALATHLYQHTLDALGEPDFPMALLQAVLSLQAERSIDGQPTLQCLPDFNEEAPAFQCGLASQVEVYYAAAEVAEELNRTATSSEDAHSCYTCAERCFHVALRLANAIVSSQEREPGYLVRCYQRYACILEERSIAAPELWEETSRTLMGLLKNGLPQVQNAIISAQIPL